MKRFCVKCGKEALWCRCFKPALPPSKSEETHHLIEQSKQARTASLKDKEDRVATLEAALDKAISLGGIVLSENRKYVHSTLTGSFSEVACPELAAYLKEREEV